MNEQQVSIYDTTLRDGTQGLGLAFSKEDKLRVAIELAKFGMEYIEGGWPSSNTKDKDFFKEAKFINFGRSKLAAFGSTRKPNTSVSKDKQILDLIDAQTPVITIFGKTWKMHVEDVLCTTVRENCNMIRETVQFLKKHDKEVIYDAEHFFDGFKADPDHALETLHAATDANTIVLCDTNGGTMTDEIKDITKHVVSIFDRKIGIHTHNDCGLGVANAIAAIRSGATQVQGTINGYGERTGNCNLTTLLPNLQLKLNIPGTQDLTCLKTLSKFIDELGNCIPNPREPFVGETAFTHKGGMHVNAVHKVARSYEHIDPTCVGNTTKILISELSGQSNIILKAANIGYNLEKGSNEVLQLLQKIKALEAEGYEFEVADASFELLIRRLLGKHTPLFKLKEYHCSLRRQGTSTKSCEATVKLSINGKTEYTVAEGDGPVNALDLALRKALIPTYPWIADIALKDYKVRIIDGTQGTAAKTRVLIESSAGKLRWCTVGCDANTIEASWKAIVDSFEYYSLNSPQNKCE